MLQKFEHISNTIGKKALLLLFYFFVVVQCKTCAIYVFKIQENFKCPLCEFLKENSPKHFFATAVSFRQILPIILHSDYELSDTKSNTSKIQITGNNIIEEEQIIYTREKIPLYFLDQMNSQESSLPFVKKGKLYLKYHQLKIGAYTLPKEEEINLINNSNSINNV